MTDTPIATGVGPALVDIVFAVVACRPQRTVT